MRDYSSVSGAFWIGKTGKELRGDMPAQLLALYLMTSPHSTMTGVYHCPILYMAHETGMSIEGATEALHRLIQAGFCEYEEASESVFVVRMAAFQIGEVLKPGDKRILGMPRHVENITSPYMKQRFIDVYGDAFHIEVDSKKKEKTKPLPSPSKAPAKPGTGTGAGTGAEDSADLLAKSPPPPDVETFPPDPPVVSIPLNNNTEFDVTQPMVDEWVLTYPAVDVLQELREMRSWSTAHPTQRKTARGVQAFICRWLGREQDRGGGRFVQGAHKEEIGVFL